MVVIALENPDRLRQQILSARRVLLGRATEEDFAELPQLRGATGSQKPTALDSSFTGAGAGAAATAMAAAPGLSGDNARVLGLLERMNGLLERVVENTTGESK